MTQHGAMSQKAVTFTLQYPPSTLPAIQQVPRDPSREQGEWNVKLIASPHLLSKSRIRGALPSCQVGLHVCRVRQFKTFILSSFNECENVVILYITHAQKAKLTTITTETEWPSQ